MSDKPTTSATTPEEYGLATYAMSRHRKNKILVWKSRVHENRVYEFTLASRFRMAGVFSWRCLQCSLIREKRKKLGQSLENQKVPLLLVDNDVIKEDPDRPNNAPHFCQGRDLIESAVLRSKLLFYQVHEKSSCAPVELVEGFSDDVAEAGPFQLSTSQKDSVQKYINDHVTKGAMKKTLERRRSKVTESPMIAKKVNCKPHQKYGKSTASGSNQSFVSKYQTVRRVQHVEMHQKHEEEDVFDEYIDVID